MHGRDHLPTGADPIPGLTGGGGAHQFGAGWSGPYPINVLNGAVWKVPLVDEAPMTFDLTRMLFRLEAPGSTSTQVRVEKSAGGSSFSASVVGTLTLAAGAYETSTTTGLGSVTSGNLLRIVWLAAGTNARGFLVELEGVEA